MADRPKTGSRASILLPVWGLASAGGALGFFGGFWVLPPNWSGAGVVAGVIGGAVAGLRLGRWGQSSARAADAEPGAAADDGGGKVSGIHCSLGPRRG